MVVALGATNAESQKRFARHVCHLVHDDFPLHASFALVPFVDPMTKEGGGNEDFRIVGSKLVGSQLFANELVVRFVTIK